MYKMVSVAVPVVLLFAGGCTGRHKTKEAFFSEGMKHLEANNPGSAIIFFKDALERDQNYFDARFQLARAYSVIGKYDAAVKGATEGSSSASGFARSAYRDRKGPCIWRQT